tara:strand:- start:88 stop:981 length:894 start_codon:yes stop_codon:yes gene_type:complete
MPPKKKKAKTTKQKQKQSQTVNVTINNTVRRRRRQAVSRYGASGGSVSGTPATVIQATPTSSTIDGLQFRLDAQSKALEAQRDAMKDFRNRTNETYESNNQTRQIAENPFGAPPNQNNIPFGFFNRSYEGSIKDMDDGESYFAQAIDKTNKADLGSDQLDPLDMPKLKRQTSEDARITKQIDKEYKGQSKKIEEPKKIQKETKPVMISTSVGGDKGGLFETQKTRGAVPITSTDTYLQRTNEFERKFKASGAQDLPSFYEKRGLDTKNSRTIDIRPNYTEREEARLGNQDSTEMTFE